jgi:hypothetical protein
VCGGRGRDIALQIANVDLEDVRGSLREIEGMVQEIRTEITYEFVYGEEGEEEVSDVFGDE